VRALDKPARRRREGHRAASAPASSPTERHTKPCAPRLESGKAPCPPKTYYRQLLRLIYRLLFLFVAEDRGLLLDPHADPKAQRRYLDLYATRRLRALAVKRAGSPHQDAWLALCLVMNLLDQGCTDLALPALGSFLWRQDALPDLASAALSNQHLFDALEALCVVQDGHVRRPVDWSSVQADELGSIYEALMERVPEVRASVPSLRLKDASGNDRKTTGSYYTPSALVDCLLDTALEPVLDRACQSPTPEDALLALTIVDPACGSGHFLVAAARRTAHRLAKVRCHGLEPSPPDVQRALRDVVGRCIYGVDLNPMAVELCKVSLWMEALQPGRPLSFLDAHIRHGNALLGTTPALSANPVPEKAFEAIGDDDKAVAKRLKKRHKASTLDLFAVGNVWTPNLVAHARALEHSNDATRHDLDAKEQAWRTLQDNDDLRLSWLLADLWCASFVWPKPHGHDEKNPSQDEIYAPVQDLWARARKDPRSIPNYTKQRVQEIAQLYNFFHWHLAFPHVFERGGFDVVLGNPPWERVKLQEQEFFSTHDPKIADAPNAAARKRLIANLPAENPHLWNLWQLASREAEGQSFFLRQSGRYPLCAKGDINTYAIFAEHNRSILNPQGRAGFIVPTGIATDDTTKDYFGDLITKKHLCSLYDFQSGPAFFGDIGHARFKFCLLTLGENKGNIDLSFFSRTIQDQQDIANRFSLSPEDFEILNPNTRTCPTFRSRRDADLNLAIYRRTGVLWRENNINGNPWGLSFMRMLDMANDSNLFRTKKELEAEGWTLEGNHFTRDGQRMIPLIEAKMVHHYNHRFGDYADQLSGSESTSLPDVPDSRLHNPNYMITPRYWVPQAEVHARLEGRWDKQWFLGWRDICRSTDERTVIASIIPFSGVGHTTPIMLTTNPKILNLYSNISSFVFDYIARQKVGGTHLTYGYLKQLPVLPPERYTQPAPWTLGAPLAEWMLPKILELTYTAHDLEPLARDCGYEGPPFLWNPERRAELKAELDAAFFHLYGIYRPDVEYIMDQFPIVRKQDEKLFGCYRTKLDILSYYDKF
jgi:hypothetical protein